MFFSAQVRAAENSEPNVAVSTVACFLEYQSMTNPSTSCRTAVMERPAITQWNRLASMQEVARGVWPFLALMLATVLLIYMIPDIALFIPFKM